MLHRRVPLQNVVLYRDEGGSLPTQLYVLISQVNALTDITTSNNVSGDPLWVAPLLYDFHLSAGTVIAPNPCRDTGTSQGAPPMDFDLQTRPRNTVYDIGADEF